VSFVLEIKPSARKRNAAAGRAVNRDGARWTFRSRAAAEAWADELTGAGGELVWVQAAHPADESDVDGYLLARLDRGRIRNADGSSTRRSRTEQEPLPEGHR